MKEFINSFSNREIASFTWVVILIILMMLSKSIRKSILDVLNDFFVKEIIIIILFYLSYISIVIYCLEKIGFWDESLLKDTLVWVVGTGVILIFNINKINSINHFKEIIKETLKWSIIVEFIISFYTFSLRTELIILPILMVTVALQAYASSNHKQVELLLKRFLGIVSLSISCFVVYKTFTTLPLLLTYDNLKGFLFPIILTFSSLPFIYILSVYAKYESLNKRLNLTIEDKSIRTQLKKYILRVGKINLNKITSISENIAKPTLLYNDFSIDMVKKISHGKYIGFDEIIDK